MDKKYTILGFLFLGLAFFLIYWQGQQRREQSEPWTEPPRTSEASNKPSTEEALSSENPSPTLSAESSSTGQSPIRLAEKETSPEDRPAEEIYVMENDFIRVDFTTHGGAIKRVALKQYPAFQGGSLPYLFNEESELPALSISLVGAKGTVEEYAPPYRLLKQENNRIEFSLELIPGIELFRSYELSETIEGASPYIIGHTTSFINRTEEDYPLNHIFINVGTALPTEADPRGDHLNFGYYDGQDFDYINVRKFKGGGFLGFFKSPSVSEIRRSERAVWASAKNQFFASILTPERPGMGVLAEPARLTPQAQLKAVSQGVTGSIEFDLQKVEAQAESTLKMDYYVGPKEYPRLSKLEQRQDLVMQFGFFGFIGKALLYMLTGFNNMVNNYGVAIILMTLVIRLLLWPLTAKAAQSSKKMAKIQEPLKELRERYKDNPEKMQRETLKLFQQHKINPAAGCLPILVQLPIFFALFQMLRSASELRFASFLWIQDLSLADTVAVVGGLPINPLPLIMGVTMFYQMKMMPTTMDSTQQKIFRLLPIIFTFICYPLASGLVLYWTVSNCFTILQQFITNRQKNGDELVPTQSDPTQAQKRKRSAKKNPKK